MIDFYFIRHAESEKNLDRETIGGRCNSAPLSQRGEEQSRMLAQRFIDENVNFDEVYASEAVRTTETANIVAKNIDFPLEKIIFTDKILELDQGKWENKLRKEIYTTERIHKINSNNWNFKAPGGESQREVEERMLKWIDETFLHRYQEDTRVAVFGHGLAIKCLLRGIMNSDPALTYKIVLDNTSITRLKYSDRGWHLLSVNDSGHLSENNKLKDAYTSKN